MEPSTELHAGAAGRGRVYQLVSKVAAHPSNYWGGFITDPITVALFLIWDLSILRRNVYVSLACYAGAIFAVSLCEYALHRWIFHSDVTLARAGHAMHHESPRALIGLPWFLTAAFWWSIAYVAVKLLHIPYVLSFMAAFITGYVFYAIIHHTLHQYEVKNRRLRALRTHHRIHHRFPNVNFGVTNRFWDKVFGTTYTRRDDKARAAGVR